MLEFYGAAAGIIPVFLLTIVLQTRAIPLFASTRMELEETAVLFGELGQGRVMDRQWLADLGFTTPQHLDDRRLLDRKLRSLRRWILFVTVGAYGPIICAFVALATSLGALAAGGAPWPVSLLVWPGVVLPGLLLGVLFCGNVGQKMAIASVAARSRLEERGLVAPLRVSATSADLRSRLDAARAADAERAEFLRRQMSKWTDDDPLA